MCNIQLYIHIKYLLKKLFFVKLRSYSYFCTNNIIFLLLKKLKRCTGSLRVPHSTVPVPFVTHLSIAPFNDATDNTPFFVRIGSPFHTHIELSFVPSSGCNFLHAFFFFSALSENEFPS